MSIASELQTTYENLNTQVTAQDTLVTQLQQALAEKASPLETLEATSNGTYTPNISDGYKGFSSVTVNVPSALVSSTMVKTITSSSATATGISVTVPSTGTYNFRFSCGSTNTSGTWTTQLYKNSSAISDATATWSSYEGTYSGNIECTEGDIIEIYAQSRSSSYRNIVGQLVAIPV